MQVLSSAQYELTVCMLLPVTRDMADMGNVAVFQVVRMVHGLEPEIVKPGVPGRFQKSGPYCRPQGKKQDISNLKCAST